VGSTEKCLSVVMPCFNEVATIESIVARVLASPYTGQLVIVDDGSTDGTDEFLKTLSDERILVIIQPENRGKGAAVRVGFAKVTLPYVVIQDADGEYDPDDYALLLEPLLEGKADAVYGSRFLSSGPHRVLYFWHSVGNRILTMASNILTNLNLTDMETCYKAFRREVVSSLEIEENRFGLEPEITAKLARGGWRIYEVGISYSGRTYAEGKKIGWKDGVHAFYCILKYSPIFSRKSRSGPYGRQSLAEFDSADNELAGSLESLDRAKHYAGWIYSMIDPYLGKDVLEIGAGHGTFTDLLLDGRNVTATDLSPRCVDILERRFRDTPEVAVKLCDVSTEFDLGLFDSVVMINVLEHVDEDVKVVRRVRDALRPGGHLIVFVPAFEGLYSEFDRRVGHRRRYRRPGLGAVSERAGLVNIQLKYVNSVGFFVWWLFAKQLGRTPTHGLVVKIFDVAVVPLLRALEQRWTPPLGQSLLLIAKAPE
jgi:glycosyltransferase involved in cell wall biosynthesis/phospholipid N-methyltransferase